MAQKSSETGGRVTQWRHLFMCLLLAAPVACQPSEDTVVQDDEEITDVQPPTDPDPDPIEPTPQDCEAPEVPDAIPDGTLWFQITLDDAPVEGLRVQQGGNPKYVLTDCRGNALVPYQDRQRALGPTIIASHPEARIRAYEFEQAPPHTGPFQIALTRFNPADNQRYEFQHPGTPTDRSTTARCGHCHEDINDAWYDSSHRTSATNPRVQDHYSGTNSLITDQASCEALNGEWRVSRLPGTDERGARCFVTDGALQIANPDCDDGLDCGENANFAGCADCHAPSINGTLGGRDLLEARDIAYNFGVHCDVCHRVNTVESLDTTAGVGGRLNLHRPSERSPSQALGLWFPLTFGPRHDVPNPRMGSVQRDHYQDGYLCSGCHELEQGALSPTAAIDTSRWPSGKLPVQSTFSEWKRGPMGDKVACNACHMPPNPKRANSSHLDEQPANTEGISAGFIRPTGSLRHHSWVGPRTEGSRMLELSATLKLSAVQTEEAWQLNVTTQNVGPGHAIPTGDPSRHLVLEVDGECDGSELKPKGGDTIPDYGGHTRLLETLPSPSEMNLLPIGTIIRAVQRGNARDYNGIPPFEAGGRFSSNEKGIYDDQWAGESILVANDNGQKVWSPALPSATHYFVVEPTQSRLLAGKPGSGFARVMLGTNGERYVPHYKAIDVASDNRLAPGQAVTTTHLFETNCETPRFSAKLFYRNSPAQWMQTYGWPYDETLMTEAEWSGP